MARKRKTLPEAELTEVSQLADMIAGKTGWENEPAIGGKSRCKKLLQ